MHGIDINCYNVRSMRTRLEMHTSLAFSREHSKVPFQPMHNTTYTRPHIASAFMHERCSLVLHSCLLAQHNYYWAIYSA